MKDTFQSKGLQHSTCHTETALLLREVTWILAYSLIGLASSKLLNANSTFLNSPSTNKPKCVRLLLINILR